MRTLQMPPLAVSPGIFRRIHHEHTAQVAESTALSNNFNGGLGLYVHSIKIWTKTMYQWVGLDPMLY